MPEVHLGGEITGPGLKLEAASPVADFTYQCLEHDENLALKDGVACPAARPGTEGRSPPLLLSSTAASGPRTVATLRHRGWANVTAVGAVAGARKHTFFRPGGGYYEMALGRLESIGKGEAPELPPEAEPEDMPAANAGT